MPDYRDDEIVMVPVPKSRLGAVYTALANPVTEASAPVKAEKAVEVVGQGAWTVSDIGRLEAELAIPAIRAFLTHLAEQAPKVMTFGEAVRATGIEASRLRAQLGSLTKTSKRVFERTTWPMSVRSGEAGEAIYSMDPKVAQWWLEAIKRTS
jgi:hypothetical protein